MPPSRFRRTNFSTFSRLVLHRAGRDDHATSSESVRDSAVAEPSHAVLGRFPPPPTAAWSGGQSPFCSSATVSPMSRPESPRRNCSFGMARARSSIVLQLLQATVGGGGGTVRVPASGSTSTRRPSRSGCRRRRQPSVRRGVVRNPSVSAGTEVQLEQRTDRVAHRCPVGALEHPSATRAEQGRPLADELVTAVRLVVQHPQPLVARRGSIRSPWRVEDVVDADRQVGRRAQTRPCPSCGRGSTTRLSGSAITPSAVSRDSSASVERRLNRVGSPSGCIRLTASSTFSRTTRTSGLERVEHGPVDLGHLVAVEVEQPVRPGHPDQQAGGQSGVDDLALVERQARSPREPVVVGADGGHLGAGRRAAPPPRAGVRRGTRSCGRCRPPGCGGPTSPRWPRSP